MKTPFINKEDLETIVAEFPTPFHLYDEKGIREKARAVNQAFSWNKGFKEYFAVKATPTPAILKILQEEGCGVDCSSYVELLMSHKLDFPGSEIMFSSNNTPDKEYAYARELGATINLDAFEVVDTLGDAPDYHLLPVGNAGNITAYWKGYKEYSEPYTNRDGKVLEPVATKRPIMWGFQAAGAAPIVAGHPIEAPETIATAIRIGNPASWEKAEAARDESGGVIEAVTDEEILEAHRWLSAREGVFVEPASAAGVAGLLKKHRAGEAPEGKTIVITVTGHGLKDPQWALEAVNGVKVEPTKAPFDVVAVADILDLH